ncbi:hypothetical protein [Chryseolinea lacunae]|uniref:Uncharacterized protein n=1 Tax=Chryseolinea lacunae TaxID=2801331 RepID=A0ABS1KQF3_9BACT|nr:hypothetical protein [Chryseolinea lacunae]MBL0740511.1 hypothetical protein [Chryseolinea lacunae]
MTTLEFEDLQRIWDAEHNKALFAIDETALHNRILTKQRKARAITHISELLLIVVNLAAGGFVFGITYFNARSSFFMYGMAVWMLATAVYVALSRLRRIRGDRQFDRSLHGDLQYAISVAGYQVRLSHLMRLNVIPIGVFIALSMWEGGKPWWIAGVTLVMLSVVYYFSGWEHQYYKSRKRELEILQDKLVTNQ